MHREKVREIVCKGRRDCRVERSKETRYKKMGSCSDWQVVKWPHFS